MRGCTKQPQGRYATAQELAADLERWLKNEPIRARRPSLLQRVSKWRRRHNPAVTAGAVVILMALALAGYIGWARHERAVRRVASEKLVLAALEDSRSWQEQGCLPEALSAARCAAGLLPGVDVDEALRQQVHARLAELEAEVAVMRRALRQAGGGIPDRAAEINNVREVAKLRSADLLQRAENTHAELREVMTLKVAGRALRIKINELGNDLASLWMALAAYGLGGDPWPDNVRLSDTGFSRPRLPPDYGIPGPYACMGLPRLHERFLEASGAKGKAAEKKRSDFKKLVGAYSNPAVFPHRASGERVYDEYRQGQGLFTRQYVADLNAVDQWLTDLEVVLGKVPTYFEKAP
jgi:hypothetical protein